MQDIYRPCSWNAVYCAGQQCEQHSRIKLSCFHKLFNTCCYYTSTTPISCSILAAISTCIRSFESITLLYQVICNIYQATGVNGHSKSSCLNRLCQHLTMHENAPRAPVTISGDIPRDDTHHVQQQARIVASLSLPYLLRGYYKNIIVSILKFIHNCMEIMLVDIERLRVRPPSRVIKKKVTY